MKPIVVAYGNNPDECKRLETSLERYGWPYKIVGLFESWRGWSHRLRTVWDTAKEVRDRYTHLIHVDAYDVLANSPVEDFEEAWTTANYDNAALILAAEVNCWPKRELAERHPPSPSPWKYSHSQFCLDLARMDEVSVVGEITDGYDDQLWLMERFLDWKYPIRLDAGCFIIQSIAFCHPWQAWFEKKGVKSGKEWIENRVTGAMPMFLHANGKTNCSWWPKT